MNHKQRMGPWERFWMLTLAIWINAFLLVVMLDGLGAINFKLVDHAEQAIQIGIR